MNTIYNPFDELSKKEDELSVDRDVVVEEEIDSDDEVIKIPEEGVEKRERPRSKYYIVKHIGECKTKKELNNILANYDELPEGMKVIKGREIFYRPVQVVTYEFDE